MGHQNREAMAHVGVRVEPTVRLGREVERHFVFVDLLCALDLLGTLDAFHEEILIALHGKKVVNLIVCYFKTK